MPFEPPERFQSPSSDSDVDSEGYPTVSGKTRFMPQDSMAPCGYVMKMNSHRNSNHATHGGHASAGGDHALLAGNAAGNFLRTMSLNLQPFGKYGRAQLPGQGPRRPAPAPSFSAHTVALAPPAVAPQADRVDNRMEGLAGWKALNEKDQRLAVGLAASDLRPRELFPELFPEDEDTTDEQNAAAPVLALAGRPHEGPIQQLAQRANVFVSASLPDGDAADDTLREDERVEREPFLQKRRSRRSRKLHDLPWSAAWLVHSYAFEHLIGFIVVLNAAVLGWQANHSAEYPHHSSPLWVMLAETGFCVVFVMELFIRVHVHGWYFIHEEVRFWNLFDLGMVALQVADQFTMACHVWKLPLGGQVLAVFRLLRLAQIVRVIRVLHLFVELRTIVESISSSVGSLAWALLLLMMMIYAFSVFFLQVIADSDKLRTHPHLSYWFGSLDRTILTMFECIVGGVSWDEVIVPLVSDVSPVMGIIFCTYIVISFFAIMNLVTAVFVENVTKTVKEDKDSNLALHISELFLNHLDEHEEIMWEEFSEKMSSETMHEYFKAIDVNPSEAHTLFQLLDADGSGSVDADEIVNGCLKLRGPAKSLDISLLMRAVSMMQDSIDSQFTYVSELIKMELGDRMLQPHRRAERAPESNLPSEFSHAGVDASV